MASMESTTSRRALIAGFAALPAFALAGQALATPGIDRSAWDRAMAEWIEANQEHERISAIWTKAFEAIEVGSPSFDTMHLNHSMFAYRDRLAVAHTLDIDHHLAQFLDGEGSRWFSLHPEVTKAEARAAAESVREWRRQHQALKDRHDFDRTSEAADAALNRYGEASSTLMTMPAPDGAALLWKFEEMFGEDADAGQDSGAYCNEWIAVVMADARRLLDRRV